jgi:ribosomal protein S18 acetylase RimI-like enzyme
MPPVHEQTTRQVGPEDRALIEGLMAMAHWRHAHLDWLAAGDLVGLTPFLLLLERGRPSACLACPPDPPGVAWLRVFAGVSGLPASEAWHAMWPAARESAIGLGAHTAAALTADVWMASLLGESGFAESNRVVFLEHQGRAGTPIIPAGAQVRAYRPSDLQALQEVDQQAFDGLWQYSRPVLAAALAQAASVTILEAEGAFAGYQLSTASALGAHLARLAVRPVLQGRGYGRALVEHLLYEFGRSGFDRVSVNTQADNAPSLRLYRRLGFRDTGQSYPVFTLMLCRPGATVDQGGAAR